MPKQMLLNFEFHVSRLARDRYQFDQTLFATNGNVIFANFHAARVFAQRMNAKRDLVSFPEQVVRAGHINAMGLIDEILHLVVSSYRQQVNPAAMDKALAWLNEQIGADEVNRTLRQFAEEFPPVAVYQRQVSLDDYLAGESVPPDGGTPVPNRLIVLEELLMLWIANMNPAFAPFLELFDDANLEKLTPYLPIINSLHAFFDTQPFFGPDHQNLVDMLRAPALNSPHSLSAQLEFIRTRWSAVLGRYLYRLLSSLDLIKEEEKVIFGFGGQPTAQVLEFTGAEYTAEPERFSPDREWMPRLTLMAKNSYVWLDQLSKKYRRPIRHLDEIPDEELDSLARWGFTGLWLIGLWERSMASKTIKQMRGNQDAVASAYSLFSYEIAADLGGDEAYRSLRDRAWKRGIRLASDMVPNHMGIDSRWVVEHPDWFVALDYSPFPSYTFNGPNLSWDSRVGIFLEDHYYNNSDAAVVFKRVDFWTGSEKFIYHGNDGTSMPWNDTAQLNYLLPEVREAVIQTILHVARKFPVIRFDAAMTLAKKHYERLWFPEPGSGGDIPSRAEQGMTKEQFDRLFPQEFWREVVDRVAQEVPDTLLLAEAFWLMEGYFVRTLGMHRVYNSAFMNMMRDEKNQEYRLAIKNTLEFDPEILKRYVNFMNNPDERTAVDQFGKGDKYFGICTVMATMPGLPMFGHGQVEGFTEKYGMEFQRAYWDERPDGYLVERHEREIFPLLRRRYLFAEVKDFLLYDFFSPEGYVNEDVFAYSNRAGGERGLVLYHNKFATARGWIRSSVAYTQKTGPGPEDRVLVQKSLGEGLGLSTDPSTYVIFRDVAANLEYIRSCAEIHAQGLYAELEAYKYQVFVDFRQVQDNEWGQYAQLARYLNGSGVPSIEDTLKEIFLQPIHTPFRELVNAGMFNWLLDNRTLPDGQAPATQPKAIAEAGEKLIALLEGVNAVAAGPQAPEGIAAATRRELAALLALPALEARFPWPRSRKYKAAIRFLNEGRVAPVVPSPDEVPGVDGLGERDLHVWGTLLGWVFTHRLGQVVDLQDYSEQSRAWLDEWMLGKLLARTLHELGLPDPDAQRCVALVKLLAACENWWQPEAAPKDRPFLVLQEWLKNSEVQRFLGVNRYQGLLWFNKEAFEEWMWWLFVLSAVEVSASDAPKPVVAAEAGAGETVKPVSPPATVKPAEAVPAAGVVQEKLVARYDLIKTLLEAEELSAYQVEKLLKAAKSLG